MSRFIIVSMPGAAIPGPGRFAEIDQADAGVPRAGCAWLFSAVAGVDDAEGALRAAVGEFFATEEGQAVREGEGLATMGWCDALPWVPDEIWQRHGLTVFRHPDVERIILDEEEDLAEELFEALPIRSSALASAVPSS
jgi:hypothetical protein